MHCESRWLLLLLCFLSFHQWIEMFREFSRMKSKISKLCEDTLKKSRTNRRLPRISVRSSRWRHRFVCSSLTAVCVAGVWSYSGEYVDVYIEQVLWLVQARRSTAWWSWLHHQHRCAPFPRTSMTNLLTQPMIRVNWLICERFSWRLCWSHSIVTQHQQQRWRHNTKPS